MPLLALLSHAQSFAFDTHSASFPTPDHSFERRWEPPDSHTTPQRVLQTRLSTAIAATHMLALALPARTLPASSTPAARGGAGRLQAAARQSTVAVEQAATSRHETSNIVDFSTELGQSRWVASGCRPYGGA